jgi:hypothetical protein
MIDDYHGERKMILNENYSRASRRHFSQSIKNDTKKSHLLYFLCFKNAFIGNVAINIYGCRDALV